MPVFSKSDTLAIIGSGIMGKAIGRGLIQKKVLTASQIVFTARREEARQELESQGLKATTDNKLACKKAKIVLIAVRPGDILEILNDLAGSITKDQIVISIVSSVKLEVLEESLGQKIPVIRAMPNTAVTVGQSMTCLVAGQNASPKHLEQVKELFAHLGSVTIIRENLMASATALCACGIAFFMRAIRAAGQGGVEIGFHAEEAIKLVAQTAKGAAELVLQGIHPESAVDEVTTPQGCTIVGLNQMEHHGFSSALIKGIVTSAEKAQLLFNASNANTGATSAKKTKKN
jgi:pyrroline-5-carboxylate reductase